MSIRRHSLLKGRDVGSVVRWEVVDATARDALTLTAVDNGSIAKLTDGPTYWILVDYSVPTWNQIDVPGGVVNLEIKEDGVPLTPTVSSIDFGSGMVASAIGDDVTVNVSGAVTTVNSQSGDVFLDKTDIGLANVDNTSDAAKPISTATQTALDGKAATSHAYDSHSGTVPRQDLAPGNPNRVIGYDGLGNPAEIDFSNVDNTSDLAKPVSTATQTALDAKSDATHDHTLEEVVTGGTTDNDVTVVDPVILRDGGTGALTPLTVEKTGVGGQYRTTVPAIKIDLTDILYPGVTIEESTTGNRLFLAAGTIEFEGPQGFSLGGREEGSTPGDLVLTGNTSNSTSAQGGSTYVRGGIALGFTSRGGDVNVYGGGGNGAPDGDVHIGGFDDTVSVNEIEMFKGFTIRATPEAPALAALGKGQVWVDSDDARLKFTDETDSDETLVYASEIGTAASRNIGTAVGDVVELIDSGGPKLPAVDGSLLTGIVTGGSDIVVEDGGVELTAAVTKFNFTGAGVTLSEPVADEITVDVQTGGAVEVEDDVNGVLTTAVTKFLFAGDGVTVTEPVPASNEVTVTVAGGAAPVASVFGRQGLVLALPDDYAASQIHNDSTVLGTYVDDGLDNLQVSINNHVADSANPHDTSLSDAILSVPADNDVNVAAANPVILRDGAAAAVTPFTVSKANSLTGPTTPSLLVEHNLTSGGIDVEQVSSGLITRVTPSGILFEGDATPTGYTINPTQPSAAGDGKDVALSAGVASVTGNQDGGTLTLNAGAGVGTGNAGIVNVGTASTDSVSIGAPAAQTNVLGELAVAGSISLGVGETVDGVDVGQLKLDHDSHAANHINGGTDEITAQALGSGVEAIDRYMKTDGAGGWTMAPIPIPGGVDVEKDGAPVGSDFQVMNFTGTPFTVTDVGGVATINVAAGTAPVDSWGPVGAPRTGIINPIASDYDASQIDNDSTVDGLFVDDALEHLDTNKVETTDTRVPTQDENDALAGTGVPSSLNVYVTEDTLTTHEGLAFPHSGLLSELNAAVTDATLIDTSDSRLSDARTPVAHSQAFTTVDSVPQDRILGRTTAGTGTAEALTAAAARTLLNVADGANVVAAAPIADNALVRGDVASEGIQQSGITVSDTDDLSGVGDLTLTGNIVVSGTVDGVDLGVDVAGHLADTTTNPHAVDIETLGTGMLAHLNDSVTDATLAGVGTDVGDAVQLVDIGAGVAGLPVVDGSNLTGLITAEVNDLTSAVTWANVPNANITTTSVTQHVASIDHDATLNYAADQHRVVGVGNTAGKTAYQTTGYYYHDTTVGTYERWSGSAWEDVGVAVDDVTLEVTSDLHVKDAGIIATTKLSATGTKNSTTFLRGDDTWAVPAGGGAGGLSGYGSFLYDTTLIGTGIASGDIRFNNASITAATAVYISDDNVQGIDISSKLALLSDWELSWARGDGTVYGTALLGTGIDQTTYWEFPLTGVVGDVTISNNDELILTPLTHAGGDVFYTTGTVSDNQIARFDTNGNQIQGGTNQPTVDDTGNIGLNAGNTVDNVDVSELFAISIMAQDTICGRITASTGAPEELTSAQATSILDNFSTTTTTSGTVPGSNNGGATVYLNGNGAWTTPAGGGGSTARDRASAAVTAATISANTLITSATNLSGALIDYQTYTFDTDLEIYINGKLMRNGTGAGSNFDVYPSAVPAEQAVGAFYCEFDIHQDDVIQMMYGTGAGSATDTFTYHEGGTYNASLSTSTWVGPPNGSVWTTAAKAQSFGTNTDPTAQPFEVGYVVPVDCHVPRIECWYRVNNTAVEGELAVYRHRWTSGSATVSTALVGSCTVASGGATGNTYDASINVNVDLLQGDRLGVYYRSAGTPAGGYTCYYTATVTMER